MYGDCRLGGPVYLINTQQQQAGEHVLERVIRFGTAFPLLLLLPLPALAADWKAVEKTETYAVTGTTGMELYASIGARV